MTINERIVEEASLMFKTQGIRSVTMDEIARSLGVSKRTIYENFKDKDELLRACLLYHSHKNEDCRLEILSDSSNVIEAIFRLMLEGMKNMNEIHPSFFTDLRKYHYKLWNDVIVSRQQENLNHLKELIKEGISQGLFRGDINIEIISRVLNVQLQALSDDQLFPVAMFTRAEIFMNIIVNFTRGIATRNGIEIIEKLIENNKI